VGDRSKILAIAESEHLHLAGTEIVDVKDHLDACARAVALVHEGAAGALMKGHVHSNVLLGQVTKSQGGLRTTRRLSRVFVMDTPGLDKVLLITDAAVNIAPNLETKVDIVQNAIDLALALGVVEPKVGVLSAVETVNPKIPSTLDAAVLSKMADRGQIRGGIVDGPLAMDNAVDIEAALTKGITSLVAGQAQVLVAPNLESGNMLAKELFFISGAVGAGLVRGARCPIILTSRADNELSRLASCALALAYQFWVENGVSIVSTAKQAMSP
jgi:phosphate butyryltransferase